MERAHEKFLNEAAELIDDLEKAVLQLDKSREDATQIEEVFRVMHTFKGTAKMFGFDRIGEFTHYLENIFDALRQRKISLSDEIFEVTLRSVDYIRVLLVAGDSSVHPEHDRILQTVKTLSDAKPIIGIHAKTSDNGNGKLFCILFKPDQDFLKSGNNPLYLLEDIAAHGMVYIKTFTDDIPVGSEYIADQTYLYWNILLFTTADVNQIRGEFLFVEDQCTLNIEKLGEVNLLLQDDFLKFVDDFKGVLPMTLLSDYERGRNGNVGRAAVVAPVALRQASHQTIRVTYDKIDKLMSIVSELVTTQARLSLFSEGTKETELEEIAENVEKLVRQLRDETFSISLLPVSHLSMRFERLVRDTSKELNKKIKFITIGGETELDKKIIENLMDPMLHILRNSMDHGIELPEERKRLGKDEIGTIMLKSYYAGTDVVIEIHDDGAGIDRERVWKKALEMGLAKETDELSDKEVYNFIFHPGFSTAREISNVSGRGVGMDVVNRAIRNLRGEIEVDSHLGKGSVMRLKLPLSLSIIDGLLVGIEKANYVIPLTAVDKCYEMEREAVKPDMHDLIVLDGEQIPYVGLREVFDYKGPRPQYVNLIVAHHDGHKVAFEVDTIIDEYQAVIKPLGKIYREQDFASGATILGNGRVALVLDTNRLIEKLSTN